MPTSHKRIAVTKDEELAEALDSVAPLYPNATPARLVHDLAIKGADAALEQQRTRKEALERVVELSTGRDRHLIDWDVLRQARDIAWGQDVEP